MSTYLVALAIGPFVSKSVVNDAGTLVITAALGFLVGSYSAVIALKFSKNFSTHRKLSIWNYSNRTNSKKLVESYFFINKFTLIQVRIWGWTGQDEYLEFAANISAKCLYQMGLYTNFTYPMSKSGGYKSSLINIQLNSFVA